MLLKLKQLKAILRRENLLAKDFAKEVGVTYSSYRSMTRKNAESVPKWVTAFVKGYDLGRKSKSKK